MGNNFLLEPLATCHDANTNLIMYFMVNMAFTNHSDQFNNMEELEFPMLTNKTTSEFTLPLFLNKSKFDDSLLSAPQTLKDYIAQYKHEKKIFDLTERHDIDELELETSYKNFFTNNFIVDIFVFIIAIVSVITTMIIIYNLCKHNKLRTLVVSLALQQVKEVKAVITKEEDYMCKCTFQFYIILALSIAIIGLVIFTILQVRRIKLCRGQLFLNIVKIMFFISNIQYYVPIKLCKTADSIHLFKITGKLTSDKVKLNKHYIWDILDVDWSEVKVTFNGKVINLPKSITVKLWDKFKVRHMMGSQSILFHLIFKQAFNWFTLTLRDEETDSVLIKSIHYYRYGKRNQSGMQFHLWLHQNQFADGHGRCRLDSQDG